mmetsp:Transcript_49462/g.88856  ORF Transcript_49462/g.88856 Transcript_49462/m.88856 type:complete len:513 (+) Transcript_49462:59-1597(+)
MTDVSIPRDGDEPELWKHLEADDVLKVASLLEAKADVRAKTPPFNWTPLHAAAGYGACESATLLLQARAEVDALAEDLETPLHLAAQSGHEKMIGLLVAARATVDATSEDGETPLHVAVQHLGGKGLDHLSTLIELRADPAKCNSEGHNALALARVMTNRADEIKEVLGSASEVNLTPSASAGHTNDEMEKVLQTACQRGQVDVVQHLMGILDQTTLPASASRSMVAAAAGGNVEVAEALLKARADISGAPPDEFGTSPLIAAADSEAKKEGAIRMLKWLLAQRANVNSASADGATALMAASSRGSTEGVQALLSGRADPDQQAKTGWTALMFAGQSGRVEVGKMLLDARAQLDHSNFEGNTARSLAAANGHTELAKVLDTRARLNARRAKAGLEDQTSVEDTRDLDDLLASLGEGGGKKSKSGKKAKEGSAGTKPEEAKEVKANQAEKQKVESKAKGKASKNAPEAKPSPKVDPRVQALREKLKVLAAKRAELDAEEAQVKEELQLLEKPL